MPKLVKGKIKLSYIGKSDPAKAEDKTLNLMFDDIEKGISLHHFF